MAPICRTVLGRAGARARGVQHRWRDYADADESVGQQHQRPADHPDAAVNTGDPDCPASDCHGRTNVGDGVGDGDAGTVASGPDGLSPPHLWPPLGDIPPGWKVYRGTLPFVIAYPPDWIVDESQIAQNLVYFYAPVPDRSTFMVIATTGEPEANPNLDVLRDHWFKSRTRQCLQYAVDVTRQEQHAGVDFATVGATCDLSDGLAYSYTGIGIRRQVPWIFEFNAPYGAYDVARTEVFLTMIGTWNIYDDGGR